MSSSAYERMLYEMEEYDQHWQEVWENSYLEEMAMEMFDAVEVRPAILTDNSATVPRPRFQPRQGAENAGWSNTTVRRRN